MQDDPEPTINIIYSLSYVHPFLAFSVYTYVYICGHECKYRIKDSKGDHEKTSRNVEEAEWEDPTECTWPKWKSEARKYRRIPYKDKSQRIIKNKMLKNA